MKAESALQAAKPSRNSIYTRPTTQRATSSRIPHSTSQNFPSPSCGVSKSRSKVGTSSTLASPRRIVNAPKRSPNTLLTLEYQRRRQLQVISLERHARTLLEEEYRDDVKSYMHQMESLTMGSAASIDMQPELKWSMRGCLLEFLIEVHLRFHLCPETLYLTCNIVDRYVSRRVVYKKHYQLVGCAALWIAAKFEDAKERVPTVQDLRELCSDAYEESAFIQMEGHVLATIAWKVGHPTAEAWLRLACTGFCFEDAKTQHVARFLMEITLFYRDFVSFPSSVIAGAALLLARYVLKKQRRPFEETESVLAVVQILDSYLAERLDQVSPMVVMKYSFSYFSKASTLVRQYYLQGSRYLYVPYSIPTTPALPTAPVTPVSHRPRVQKWPSSTSSSSESSTPSFSSSDFTDFSSSEFDDDSSMPATPPGPGTTSSGSVDPFAMQGMTLTSSTSFGNLSNVHMGVVSSSQSSSSALVAAAVVLATSTTNASSNKENMPVSMSGANIGGGNGGSGGGGGAHPLGVVQDGTRSRKSSLEGLVVGSMDLCQPSPASCEATYVPRAALHSLTPNGAARASQTSLNSLNMVQ